MVFFLLVFSRTQDAQLHSLSGLHSKKQGASAKVQQSKVDPDSQDPNTSIKQKMKNQH